MTSVFTITNSLSNPSTLYTTLGNPSTSVSYEWSSTSATPYNYQTASPFRRPLQPPTTSLSILTYPFPTDTCIPSNPRPSPGLFDQNTDTSRAIAKKNALAVGFAVAAVVVIFALIILRFCKRGNRADRGHIRTPIDLPAEPGGQDFERARQEAERLEREEKMRVAREEVQQGMFDDFDSAYVMRDTPPDEEEEEGEGAPRLRWQNGSAFEWDLTEGSETWWEDRRGVEEEGRWDSTGWRLAGDGLQNRNWLGRGF
ncbi:hypothetical protein BDD12DRAFT_806167 [Trichophaea hybrida]|nr:hypothetical protein BDD12DRAFT_806167 [Trichophaea hybrida]